MTTFHEREQAFEAKYARDEEFRFLVTARRDKLFARWTAARLSISAVLPNSPPASRRSATSSPRSRKRSG